MDCLYLSAIPVSSLLTKPRLKGNKTSVPGDKLVHPSLFASAHPRVFMWSALSERHRGKSLWASEGHSSLI